MRRLVQVVQVLALLAPLSLVAAGPVQTVPDRTPGENDLQRPVVVGVYDWLTILPAPLTPDGFAPAPGAREQWPLHGPITQPFGCTGFELERPAQDCPGGFHTGLDIGLPQGTPIRAAGPGLAYPFQDDQRYGNHVLIQEVGGISTVYGHMVRTNVSWGQPVKTGDVIGFVGSTGNSTGPHLHFEVRFAGVPFDPMLYLDGSPADPFPLPSGWPGAPRAEWRGLR
ncbi:MAG TPA: M23 family metallopeptidase [Candidatus Dormibacteraeota bacterium]